jgi:Uncharacterized protein conserved in bacteria (DUF2252)
MDSRTLDVHQATSSYEAWLGRWIPLINDDLQEKHKRMREDQFEFLRATFYRWAQRWPVVCAELADAPAVLAVGDVHVENFGTWRDAEGRLVWGINDVDDAWTIPYTNDLVRLATSAELASKVTASLAEASDAIVAGYADGLRDDDPLPFVLAERHGRLRHMAVARLQDPSAFWDDLKGKLRPIDGAITPEADRFLASSLPAPALPYARYRRRAGLGSLGRPRFAALADWLGGRVAREVKLLAPSSWLWANPTVDAAAAPIYYGSILAQAVRCPDPVVAVSDRWVVRRLAPDSSRIELKDVPEDRDELHLLTSMGRELANIHRGSPDAIQTVRDDLAGRPEGWLRDAAAAMRRATIEDFDAWRQRRGG